MWLRGSAQVRPPLRSKRFKSDPVFIFRTTKLDYVFMVLKEHPYGREMFRQLLAAEVVKIVLFV